MANKKEQSIGDAIEVVKIIKQESIHVDGELKIKYTLSDGSEQIKGL